MGVTAQASHANLVTGTPPGLAAAVRAARSLTVYRGVLADRVGEALLALLEATGQPEGDVSGAYFRFIAELWDARLQRESEPVGNVWQDHLLHRLLWDDNPFTREAEREAVENLPSQLKAAAAHDLASLETLAQLDPRDFRPWLVNGTAGARDGGPSLPSWDEGESTASQPAASSAEEALRTASGMKQWLLSQKGWHEHVDVLAAFHRRHGAGLMGRYRAFRWVGVRPGVEPLQGIPSPDPVRLSNLIGYENERRPVVENTARFVRGLPANNVLLYGERGTGKSATVKALLHEFGDQGLRLIEVPRRYLSDLPDILVQLRGRAQYFILFIDDLSFEDSETTYKDLKAVLEGSLEVRPRNVLVYATSNRRHLVRERFSERDERGLDEIRRSDTVQEKLSLADRFGLTVVFAGPDQEGYLAIVEGLARQEGIDIDRDQLRQEALRWTLWHNDRSARTARQFIDDLKARLGMR